MRPRWLTMLVVTTLVPLLLGGCIKYYWSRPGSTPEAFARDSEECAKEAAAAGVGRVARDRYRGCLFARGYVRGEHVAPVGSGYYRGIEDEEQLVLVQRASGSGATSTQTALEQQLAVLDDLRSRGRITDDEYAIMRRRIVESATPSSLAAARTATSAVAGVAPQAFLGRWRRTGSTPGRLEIAGQPAGPMQWLWETTAADGRPYRASGQGELKEGAAVLTGFVIDGAPFAVNGVFVLELRVVGDRLMGTAQPPTGAAFLVELLRDS